MCRRQEGEGHEGHEAPRHEEEEGRGCGGGADEGHAEEVSLSWAHTSNGARAGRRRPVRWLSVCGASCISGSAGGAWAEAALFGARACSGPSFVRTNRGMGAKKRPASSSVVQS